MTTATRRGIPRLLSGALLLLLCALSRPAAAITLDDRGEMRLGLRAYSAVRLGTEATDQGQVEDNKLLLSSPKSAAGHVRQHRYFLELKIDHDLRRLASTSRGVSWLFGWLHPNVLKYSMQYRGEGEGIYDYGPKEYSDSFAAQKQYRLDLPTGFEALNVSPIVPSAYIRPRVSRLRRVARIRNRLFLAYLDVEKGPVEIRVGRQILAWGETDVFRLLDNINPVDQGFGGFLIPLDERRVPLDMLRGSYRLGSIGPLSDTTFEAFGALGQRVSTKPGIPAGSPWMPGGLGTPNPALEPVLQTPHPSELRGGARLGFTAGDITWNVAHYYTYLDTPTAVFHVPPGSPFYPNSIQAVAKVPRVQITGGSLTFPVTSWYSVVRSEAAYFRGEPFNRQGRGNSADSTGAPGSAAYNRLLRQHNTEGGLDPFLWPGFFDTTRLVGAKAQQYGITGTPLQRDTVNASIGLDANRFLRWLNPGQTFFISTQMFYKHVLNSPGDLVLPVPVYNTSVPRNLLVVGTPGCGPTVAPGKNQRGCRLEPHFIKLNDDQFFHTLLVTTSYMGGRIVPSLAMFYDWQGAWLAQPGVALLHDPFRFVFDYTFIEAALGAGQISALRDRDNVRFQMEYVF